MAYEGEHLGFFTEFETEANEEVLFKAGISFVSLEGAEKNLKAEIKDWDFDAVRSRARSLWDTALAKMDVSGGTDEQKVIFYTSLISYNDRSEDLHGCGWSIYGRGRKSA